MNLEKVGKIVEEACLIKAKKFILCISKLEAPQI